jgi:hypothetical protein
LRATLGRLLWLATHPDASAAELPAGRFRGGKSLTNSVQCGDLADTAANRLERLLAGEAEAFSEWVRNQRTIATDPFTVAALEEDLEMLATVFSD